MTSVPTFACRSIVEPFQQSHRTILTDQYPFDSASALDLTDLGCVLEGGMFADRR